MNAHTVLIFITLVAITALSVIGGQIYLGWHEQKGKQAEFDPVDLFWATTLWPITIVVLTCAGLFYVGPRYIGTWLATPKAKPPNKADLRTPDTGAYRSTRCEACGK